MLVSKDLRPAMNSLRSAYPVAFFQVVLCGALVLLFQLSGCTISKATIKPTLASMPVSLGWHDQERVYYITTDITDPPMAHAAGVRA